MGVEHGRFGGEQHSGSAAITSVLSELSARAPEGLASRVDKLRGSVTEILREDRDGLCLDGMTHLREHVISRFACRRSRCLNAPA